MVSPRVSIGLPVYNGEKFIQGALDSLLQQNYEDFELIISDNASTDRTGDVCKSYAEKDKRIRYYENKSNYGAMWNYRRVFELSQGKYFKWAAHDDECYPTMLRRCVETLDQAPNSVALVYPRAEIIDEHGQIVGEPPDHVDSNEARPHRRLARVLFHVALAHSFYGLIRRNLLRRIRGYGHIASDHVILAELAMWGLIWEIPEVLFRIRIYPGNAMNMNKTQLAMQEWYDPRSGNKRVILPYQIRVMMEHLKSVRHARLAPVDKSLCLITVLVVPSWRTFLRVTGRKRKQVRNWFALLHQSIARIILLKRQK